MLCFPDLMPDDLNKAFDVSSVDYLDSLIARLNPQLSRDETIEWERAKEDWRNLQEGQKVNPSSNVKYYQDAMDVSARISNRWNYAWPIFVAQTWHNKKIKENILQIKNTFVERVKKAEEQAKEASISILEENSDNMTSEYKLKAIGEAQKNKRDLAKAARIIEQIMLRKIINEAASMPSSIGILDEGPGGDAVSQRSTRVYENLVPLNIILEIEFEREGEEDDWEKNSIWKEGEWKELPLHKVVMRVPKAPESTESAIAIARYSAHLRSHPFTFTC